MIKKKKKKKKEAHVCKQFLVPQKTKNLDYNQFNPNISQSQFIHFPNILWGIVLFRKGKQLHWSTTSCLRMLRRLCSEKVSLGVLCIKG